MRRTRLYNLRVRAVYDASHGCRCHPVVLALASPLPSAPPADSRLQGDAVRTSWGILTTLCLALVEEQTHDCRETETRCHHRW
jgi:hypothetical protein